MLNHRRINEERREPGREGLVAVAVDKDRFSQYALKWAAEHLLRRHQTVKLIHVLHRPGENSELIEQHPDTQTMDIFLPFRCFCTRRHLQSELVVLQHQDVSRALIEYVSNHAVQSLLLGSPSKNGLTRLFKATDIPSTVMKWAPDFCNVYIVSKGKCHAARSATRPFPPILAGEVPHPQILPTNISNEAVTIARYDEFSAAETGDSYINSGRPSTDSTFYAFYENLGMNPARSSTSSRAPHNSLSEIPSGSFDSERISYSSLNTDDTDEEIKRLKMELKQTVEMYHALYKETIAAKDKAIQLEQWKMKEEKRLQEALLAEEREKAKYKAAIEASEAAQKILKLEMQHRVKAEIRSLREAEEKTKVLDALGKSHMVLKYQCFFYIFVVLFLFFFYFNLIKTK